MQSLYRSVLRSKLIRTRSCSSDIRSLVGRDLLALKHLKSDEIKQLIWTAQDLKSRLREDKETLQVLSGKCVALFNQRNCPVTRVSAERGTALLGGHVVSLGHEDLQDGDHTGAIKVLARFLSCTSDLILASVEEQDDLDLLALEATVPVVSGQTKLFCPCQILAHFLTIQENFGHLQGRTIAYVGDRSNIAHSLMVACGKLGIDLNIAVPKGYGPAAEVTLSVMPLFAKNQTNLMLTSNPGEAVYRADVIVTTSWQTRQHNNSDFAGFQITRKLLKEAGANCMFLHDLPRSEQEVSDDIFYDPSLSSVWKSVENQVWTIMAVVLHLLQDYRPVTPRPKFIRGE